MLTLWRQRIACVLLALVAGLGILAPRAGGCGGSAALFCPIERFGAPPTAPISAAAVPAPFKIVLAAIVILFLIGRDPLPSAVRARLAWHRRYTETRLPRGVPWGQAHVAYAYAMRDP